ncbi:sulfite oxidase subunit YedZ [Escherichia coli]|uniref:Sulfite oxidase subunit YedZ n=1 Tax=Escherichia coli TaxID=562 RepID=A0A376S915_ECOLX|nr:sulfite oxidase subunit YedZ [Escherichia coli]
MYSASQRYCLMVTPSRCIAVSWPGFAGEFLNASDSKTGDMDESLPASCRIVPFLWLVWAINHGGLGADPVKDIQHFTGRTALKFLLAILLITPLHATQNSRY